MVATLLVEILANHASFLPKPQVPLEPEIFMTYYGTEDYEPTPTVFENNKAIVIEVDKMTARREYEKHKTDYWYWEKVLE